MYKNIKGCSNERLYDVYCKMIDRTTNKRNKMYKHYGARGIKVCNEWLNDYQLFKKWAYENGYNDKAPKRSLSIDRINNDGNYEPSNCRWVDEKVQHNNTSRNRYITYNGITKTMQQWCDEFGISKTTMFGRLQRGWSLEEAFTKRKK